MTCKNYPRGAIDNALTAAFRTVLGWCPSGDGAPDGTCFYQNEYGKVRVTHRVSVPPVLPAAFINVRDNIGLTGAAFKNVALGRKQ